jgi:hypothetical protein
VHETGRYSLMRHQTAMWRILKFGLWLLVECGRIGKVVSTIIREDPIYRRIFNLPPLRVAFPLVAFGQQLCDQKGFDGQGH